MALELAHGPIKMRFPERDIGVEAQADRGPAAVASSPSVPPNATALMLSRRSK